MSQPGTQRGRGKLAFFSARETHIGGQSTRAKFALSVPLEAHHWCSSTRSQRAWESCRHSPHVWLSWVKSRAGKEPWVTIVHGKVMRDISEEASFEKCLCETVRRSLGRVSLVKTISSTKFLGLVSNTPLKIPTQEVSVQFYERLKNFCLWSRLGALKRRKGRGFHNPAMLYCSLYLTCFMMTGIWDFQCSVVLDVF